LREYQVVSNGSATDLLPFSDPNISALPEPPVGCGQRVSTAPGAPGPLDSSWFFIKEKQIRIEMGH